MSFFAKAKDYVKEPAVAASILAPILGLGVNAVAQRRAAARDVQQHIASYKEMLAITPRLKQHDPALVSRVYSSMHSVNPTLARDPLIAGAWVDNVLEQRASLGDASFGQAVLKGLEPLAQMRNQLSAASRNEGGGISTGARLSDAVRGLGDHLQRAQDGHFAAKLKEIHTAQATLADKQKTFRSLLEDQDRKSKAKAERAELDRRKEMLDHVEQQLHQWAADLDAGGKKKTSARRVDGTTLDMFAALGR